jgi:hypothetical protein
VTWILDAAENWFVQQRLKAMTSFPVARGAWLGLVQSHEHG